MGRLGEPAVAKWTDAMIKAKKDKVMEAKETVKLSKYDKSERKAAAEAKKKAAAAKKPALSSSKPASTAKSAAAAGAMDDDGDKLMGMDDMAPPKRAPPKIG